MDTVTPLDADTRVWRDGVIRERLATFEAFRDAVAHRDTTLAGRLWRHHEALGRRLRMEELARTPSPKLVPQAELLAERAFRDLWGTPGLSVAIIAERMGRSRSWCYAESYRLKLPRRRTMAAAA